MRAVVAAKDSSSRLPIRRAATPANGPVRMTRSVNVVLVSAESIACSEVIVSPGNRETATHMRGGSTLVTVAVVVGPPLPFTVIFAPTTKSRSILAFSMMSPGHSGGFVQTAQAIDAGAEQEDDPSKDRRCCAMRQ